MTESGGARPARTARSSPSERARPAGRSVPLPKRRKPRASRPSSLPFASPSVRLSVRPPRAKLGELPRWQVCRSVSGDRVARGHDAAEDDGGGGARPAGMGPGTWRKAYGALKDSTKVGLANFNSEYKVMMTMPSLPPIDPSIHSPAAPPPGRPPVAMSHGVRLLSSIFPPNSSSHHGHCEGV